jgi:hypothetical protein
MAIQVWQYYTPVAMNITCPNYPCYQLQWIVSGNTADFWVIFIHENITQSLCLRRTAINQERDMLSVTVKHFHTQTLACYLFQGIEPYPPHHSKRLPCFTIAVDA